ncbi:hypothetical protein [Pseudomonas oryzihabitans]|uniref:hypothetical protein n=1 Tax=Pseudomonas oryzihabitans TaxID=47885 RepID=UPI0011A870C4|nr:hypothetical protein [Pseudomonas oryzihabitans]
MNMKKSCKALICAIEGELDGRHCTEEQAAAILDHALPSLTESLARVEAERDAERARGDAAVGDANEAEAQLAEAVGLLRELSGELCSAAVIAAHAASAKEIPVSTTLFSPMRKFTLKDAQCKAKTLESILTDECDRLNKFVARHAKAEQQEAKPVAVEAQGAQAGDEHENFEAWHRSVVAGDPPHEKYHDGSYVNQHVNRYWTGWQARAALATQPAGGEPVYQWHDETAWQECNSKREYLHAKDNGIRVRILWTAPPAAAHGDEAVRKDAEYFRFIDSCPIRTGVVLSRKAHEAGFDLRAECERVMAMRAQAGEGGEV